MWVNFSCVCPVVDDEFRHNIVKVVVDLRGDSRHQFVFYNDKLSNCLLLLVVSFLLMCLSAY